eukprot:s4475_g2.t2
MGTSEVVFNRRMKWASIQLMIVLQGWRLQAIFSLLRAGSFDEAITTLRASPELWTQREAEGGHSVLHWAALFGNLELAQEALYFGLEVDARSENLQTPLMWASTRGQLKVAKVLLEAKADPHAQDSVGASPFILAVQHSQIGVLLLLFALCKHSELFAASILQSWDLMGQVIEKAIINIGPDNPKVKKRAEELLSPEAMMSLPLATTEGQDTAVETAAPQPAAEPVPEASQRAEFPEEFADINLEPPLPPPGEGPPGPPVETQRPTEKQREILQGGRAELDPDLELDDEDAWGEPVGFAELVSINDQVWDPKKLLLVSAFSLQFPSGKI